METKVEYALTEEEQYLEKLEEAIEANGRVELRTPEEIDLERLAQAMLAFAQLQRQVDEIAAYIEDQVLVLGKTVTVGYTRATYSKPRKEYDYEGPAKALLANEETRPGVQLAILDNTKKVVDWRAVCKKVDVEPDVTEGEGPGKVSVKLLR